MKDEKKAPDGMSFSKFGCGQHTNVAEFVRIPIVEGGRSELLRVQLHE